MSAYYSGAGRQRGSWILIALLLLSCISASAQEAQKLRVIVADCINKSSNQVENFAPIVTDALYDALAETGKERFQVVSKQEVWEAARKIGLKERDDEGKPVALSFANLRCVAKELHVRAIVWSIFTTGASDLNRLVVTMDSPFSGRTPLGIEVGLYDIDLEECVGGGVGTSREKNIYQAANQAAKAAVRSYVQNWPPPTIVLNISNEVMILNRGLRDGIRSDNDLVVFREEGGKRVKVGKIHALQVYARDIEAEVVENIGGIRPEDIALKLYRPRFWAKMSEQEVNIGPLLHSISEITLERAAGFDPGPTYTITLYRDGTVFYFGKNHVKRKGAYIGHLDTKAFIRLAEVAETSGYFNLKDEYTPQVTTQAGVTTSVVRDSKRKTVYNEDETGPTSLWAFEMLIDAVVANVHDWKKFESEKPSK